MNSSAGMGPVASIWFNFLQRRIQLPNKNAEVITRVLVDQSVFAPTVSFAFLSYMSLMEGTSPREKLDKTYKKVLLKNWMVWPWVQIVNFKFVPLEHRVLVVNTFAIGKEDFPLVI